MNQPGKTTLYVIDGEQKIPFLRGMITHSLIERGLSFQQAYEAASLVRDRIRDEGVIEKSRLSELIQNVVLERFPDSRLEETPSGRPPARTILVRRGGSSVPFSKGILSQSLQASGLDPSVAYSIAQEIEARLLEQGRKEVDRDALRRLIYEVILEHHGSQFAERYLLWRCFKAPDRPLVLLFGGATGAGKSSVANEIAHRIGIQKIISTDTVRQMMRMMFSRDLLPSIHFSSYEAWKKSPQPEGSEAAVIEAFREQSLRVLVGVRAMIERAIQENTSLIVEGVHLVPGLLDLSSFEGQAYIMPLVVSTLNRANYLERFPTREQEARSRSARRYRENFDNIVRIQDYILEMAENSDCPIIENSHFDQAVAAALAVVSAGLREKLQIDSQDLISRAF